MCDTWYLSSQQFSSIQTQVFIFEYCSFPQNLDGSWYEKTHTTIFIYGWANSCSNWVRINPIGFWVNWVAEKNNLNLIRSDSNIVQIISKICVCVCFDFYGFSNMIEFDPIRLESSSTSDLNLNWAGQFRLSLLY